MNARDLLTAGLEELDLPVCPQAVDRLLAFSDRLAEKNKVMNLTAVDDPCGIVTRHFLDCAALAPYIPDGARVIDVGTGAGFPGLPLAILTKGDFTLLDAQRKRVDFLNETIALLGLQNAKAVHARAEEFAKDSRAAFDLAVSRAVAPLPMLCELSLPLVRTGGTFFAMKAYDCGEEAAGAENAVRVLGGAAAVLLDYEVPFDRVRRRLVRIDKTADTPQQYPRRFKKMETNPL